MLARLVEQGAVCGGSHRLAGGCADLQGRLRVAVLTGQVEAFGDPDGLGVGTHDSQRRQERQEEQSRASCAEYCHRVECRVSGAPVIGHRSLAKPVSL